MESPGRSSARYNRFRFFFFASCQRFFIISDIRRRPSADMRPRRDGAGWLSCRVGGNRRGDAATRRHTDPAPQCGGLIGEHFQPLARFLDFALEPS